MGDNTACHPSDNYTFYRAMYTCEKYPIFHLVEQDSDSGLLGRNISTTAEAPPYKTEILEFNDDLETTISLSINGTLY